VDFGPAAVGWCPGCARHHQVVALTSPGAKPTRNRSAAPPARTHPCGDRATARHVAAPGAASGKSGPDRPALVGGAGTQAASGCLLVWNDASRHANLRLAVSRFRNQQQKKVSSLINARWNQEGGEEQNYHLNGYKYSTNTTMYQCTNMNQSVRPARLQQQSGPCFKSYTQNKKKIQILANQELSQMHCPVVS